MKCIKKGIVLAAVLLFMLGVIGCGGKKAGETAASKDERFYVKVDDGVYFSTIKEIDVLKKDADEVKLAFVKGGKAYFLVTVNDEEAGSETFLRAIDETTGEIAGEDIFFSDESDRSYIYAVVTAGEDAYVYMSSSFSEGRHDRWLVKCSFDGTEIVRKNLSSIPQISGSAVPTGEMCSDGKHTYIPFSDKVIALDEEFGYVGVASETDHAEICIGDDGLLYCSDGLISGNIGTYNPSTGEIIETAIKVPQAKGVFKGRPGELLIYNASTLKSYDVNTGEIMNLFGFMDVDISATMIDYAYRDESGDLHIYYENLEHKLTGDNVSVASFPFYAHVKRYDPEEAPGQETLRLACFYLNFDIKDVITEFNHSHPGVRITVRAYMDDYAEKDDIIAAFDKDIIDKELFDIVMFPSADLKKYTSKGYFEDLMPYIENDASFDLNDYYENILFATKEGDELYTLTTEAIIRCYCADSSVFGDKEKLSLEDIASARNKYSDIPFIANADRDMVLTSFLENDMRVFLGKEDGTYDFKTREFKDLCEFASSFPDWTDDYYENYDRKGVSEDNVKGGYEIIRRVEFGEPSWFLLERELFGKTFKTYGVDSLTDTGFLILPSFTFGINSKGEHKDEAWEFIKMVADRKLDALWDRFTANRESFKQSLDNLYDTCHTSIGRLIQVNGIMYKLSMDEGDKDFFLNMIENAEAVSPSDEVIMSIVLEEMPAYFEKEKSYDEVINIIQKRVNLYLEEKK